MRRISLLALAGVFLLATAYPLAAQTPPKELLKLPGMKVGGTITRESATGMASVWGATTWDMFYLQGYVHASDRLFQMDSQRRTASGTLAELLGAAALTSDVTMRTLGLRRAAVRSLAVASAPGKEVLEAYAAGVNQWVTTHPLPPEYGALSLTKFEPWTPLDSVVIAKLLSFSLSFNNDGSVSNTTALLTYVAAGKVAGFDGTKLYFEDLWRTAPFDPFTTLEPPKAAGRAGSEVEAATAPERLEAIGRSAERLLENGTLELLRSYQRQIQGMSVLDNPLDGTHDAGSNEWGVAGRLSTTGSPLICNDPHLGLSTPSIWYPISLRGGAYNVAGNSFAGAPFVVHGHNEKVAWGSTVNVMDVTDYFSEQIVPMAASPSGYGTVYKGTPEAVLAIPEVFRKNNPGSGTMDNVTVVPPGGSIPPATLIVPRRDNGPIVSLDAAKGTAVSVQYTGWSATRELDAVMGFDLAQSVEDFKKALRYWDVGSQNFAVGDTAGNIAYLTSAEDPLREDLQASTVTGLPPWFVRDGTGGNEWLPLAGPQPEDQSTPHQVLPYEEMPQSVNPAQGWFANGNNDPVGTTIGNNPLGRLRTGGGIYYLSNTYDGFRGGRIAQVMKKKLAENGKLSPADMKEIQADCALIDAQAFVPYIVQALANARLNGADPALAAYGQNAAVVAAVGRLAEWDFTTPTGLTQGWDANKPAGTAPSAAQLKASTAATVYALWRSQMLANTIDATVGGAGLPVPSWPQAVAALRNMLDRFATQKGVGASGVNFFVVKDVAKAEDRRDVLLLKSVADGLALLAGDSFAPAFARSTNLDDYQWGKLHRIVFSHLLGEVFSVPIAGGAFPHPLGAALPGIPRQGGMGTVDASHHDARAKTVNGFMFSNGPSRRYVGQVTPAGVLGENSLPGGVSGVLGNPNYFSLLPMWLTNLTYPLVVQTEQAMLSKGRVEVEVTWRSQYSQQGGHARSVAQGDSASYFYFTSPGNAEVYVKVLDFGADSPYVLFYAGLTDYEYTVTFTNVATGKQLSFNKPAGSFMGGGNNSGLPHQVAQALYWSKDGSWSRPLPQARTELIARAPAAASVAEADAAPLAAGELLLSAGRVAVGATWKSPYSGQSGTATPVPQADAFGFFSITDASNPEVLVKVLDFGPGVPYLLFYAGLTDYEYTVTFRNVATGQSVPFKKAAGSYNGGHDKTTLLH